MFTPSNIHERFTQNLRNGQYLRPSELKYQRQLEARGWRFYVVNQSCGNAYPLDKVITIPLWLWNPIKNSAGFPRLSQYLLHEIAHGLDKERNGFMDNHGKPFMAILMEICPREWLIYEMRYKPQNLVRAGAIFCPESLDI